jgi:hypothetical protein
LFNIILLLKVINNNILLLNVILNKMLSTEVGTWSLSCPDRGPFPRRRRASLVLDLNNASGPASRSHVVSLQSGASARV